ncbi:hypothetical protein NPIL_505221 [Nephila pilipes]|uniref:Uncharacterized protein n=1 Tax=Nephila pilipes TaxID=299642 RepID=A0A8X6T4D8_NEPPI|nr:hypothetical protein NPIL_505221 [Nephila pilipes]
MGRSIGEVRGLSKHKEVKTCYISLINFCRNWTDKEVLFVILLEPCFIKIISFYHPSWDFHLQVYKDFELMQHAVYLHYHIKEHLTGIFLLGVS